MTMDRMMSSHDPEAMPEPKQMRKVARYNDDRSLRYQPLPPLTPALVMETPMVVVIVDPSYI